MSYDGLHSRTDIKLAVAMKLWKREKDKREDRVIRILQVNNHRVLNMGPLM